MSKLAPLGFLNLNKPLRMTSHDVVAAIRRRLRAQTGAKKVGHAGTLDPLADGVLVICLGAATRLSQYMMRGRKLYRAHVKFGVTTSTYDAAGDTLAQRDASLLARSQIEAALPQFIGAIKQVPPMHSAIKQDGKKLYQLARQGKTVDRPARSVTIHSINIISWRNPLLELEVDCEAGTYIRSLAHDLGAALNTGAYLSRLTRLASGQFQLRESITLATVLESDDWMRHIKSPFDALSDYARVTIAAEDIQELRQGAFIPRTQDPTASPVFAFDAQKQLIAILEPRDDKWKPHKVFPRQA